LCTSSELVRLFLHATSRAFPAASDANDAHAAQNEVTMTLIDTPYFGLAHGCKLYLNNVLE